MKRKYIFTAVLLAALTAAGFGITVLCGSGGSGSHGKSSGSTQTEGKTDDSDARTEDTAVGNREDGDAAISSKTDGNDTFNVVTSFYPVYIAAKNVIGDVEGVELHNLTEPQTGCLHDYQLTPQDMISLSHADLFLLQWRWHRKLLERCVHQLSQSAGGRGQRGDRLSGDRRRTGV